MNTRLSFDGKGINDCDDYRSRLATFAHDGAADRFGPLFAAAPETAAERDRLRSLNAELLAALEALLTKVDCGYHRDTSDMVRTRDHARAAIAKAKQVTS